MFAGPRALLRSYQAKNLSEIANFWEPGAEVFSKLLEDVQNSRQKMKSGSSADAAAVNQTIVQHSIGDTDVCKRCGTIQGLNLYNELSE